MTCRPEKISLGAVLVLAALRTCVAIAAPGDDGLERFRATYKELVETNTTLSEEILAQLVKLADDPAVSVTIPEIRGPVAQPTPLTAQILGPMETVTHEVWPGVPLIPGLEPGASDAQFMNPAGIPTYGISGLFADPDMATSTA